MLSLRRLRRYPFAWWAAVLTVAGLTGILVTHSVASAESSAQRYGGLTNVAVLVRSLPAGTVLTPADVRTEARPRAFLPDTALVLQPAGRTLSRPAAAGDIVTEMNVGTAGKSATSALFRDGERAIAVAVDDTEVTVMIGDTVDVLATFETEATAEPTVVVARDARVVQVKDRTIMVAVPEETTPKVAFALTKGTVTLALT